MSSQVYQIVYLSRATTRLNAENATALERTAREFNSTLGVTGLLLHDGARFIQALEGDESAVTEVMRRIERDPRHTSITYVHRGFVPARQFGDWAMDFHRTYDAAGERTFVDNVKLAMTTVEDMNLVAAFIGFAVLGRPGVRHRHAHHALRAAIAPNSAAAGLA